jgi:adenylate cyclase
MEPEVLAIICNDYFEGVCAAIFAQGGMVNEFIGDGVIAFFGAPHAQTDHADWAVSAACWRLMSLRSVSAPGKGPTASVSVTLESGSIPARPLSVISVPGRG